MPHYSDYLRTETKNSNKNIPTTTTIWMEVKGGGRTGYQWQTIHKDQNTDTYYHFKRSIMFQVTLEVCTLQIISADTCETSIILWYEARNFVLCLQPPQNSFIRSGRENWTREHVDLCKNLDQFGSGGVFGELFEDED